MVQLWDTELEVATERELEIVTVVAAVDAAVDIVDGAAVVAVQQRARHWLVFEDTADHRVVLKWDQKLGIHCWHPFDDNTVDTCPDDREPMDRVAA